MFVTVVTVHRKRPQVQQIEAPTIKDCLVSWANRVEVDGLDDEGRTRLRGTMADFDEPPVPGLMNLWRFPSDLGLEEPAEAMVIVVETVRR
jgi:hypothetical protein